MSKRFDDCFKFLDDAVKELESDREDREFFDDAENDQE
jgi:hypothetical protein